MIKVTDYRELMPKSNTTNEAHEMGMMLVESAATVSLFFAVGTTLIGVDHDTAVVGSITSVCVYVAGVAILAFAWWSSRGDHRDD